MKKDANPNSACPLSKRGMKPLEPLTSFLNLGDPFQGGTVSVPSHFPPRYGYGAGFA
jgi:hypothetical protein